MAAKSSKQLEREIAEFLGEKHRQVKFHDPREITYGRFMVYATPADLEQETKTLSGARRVAARLRRQGFKPIIKRHASRGDVSWNVTIEDAFRTAKSRSHSTKRPAGTRYEEMVATARAGEARGKSRAELRDVARAAAAAVFAPRKIAPSEAVIKKARSAAFKAIQRHDPSTGTATHPVAAYAHGIADIAAEATEEARQRWEMQRESLRTLRRGHATKTSGRAYAKRIGYRIKLTPSEMRAVEFARGRYAWPDMLSAHAAEDGSVAFTESEMWQWTDDVDADTEGGHSPFPLASDAFAEKLQRFYDERI